MHSAQSWTSERELDTPESILEYSALYSSWLSSPVFAANIDIYSWIFWYPSGYAEWFKALQQEGQRPLLGNNR